jgi:tRNA pseudouridine38-40 synthase
VRYFLQLAYKGTNYHGWQIQPNGNTIQSEIESALSTLLRKPISITGSGRTDSGVHAFHQIAHFDTDSELVPQQMVFKLNSILPNDIVVKNCIPVIDEAHARFDAVERGYVYHIDLARNPFSANEHLYVPYELDIDLMNQAAKRLIGRQDFESFSKVKTEVNHFYCDIRQAYWQVEGTRLMFVVRADRFLRGMIRAIVGTMLEVGRGKLSENDFVDVLKAKDRRRAGKAVSPDGLYLNQVDYPAEIYI